MEQIKTELDLVIELRDAKADEDRIELLLKAASDRTAKAEKELIELMESQDKTATAKYEGVGFVSLVKPKLYASFDKASEALVFQFLKDEQREDLIKPTVNSASLSTFVRESLENSKQIPEYIKYYLKPGIRLNAAK